MAEGSHPFPFRTRKLSPPAPMVLGRRLPGRVGRRRISLEEGRLRAVLFAFSPRSTPASWKVGSTSWPPLPDLHAATAPAATASPAGEVTPPRARPPTADLVRGPAPAAPAHAPAGGDTAPGTRASATPPGGPCAGASPGATQGRTGSGRTGSGPPPSRHTGPGNPAAGRT